MHLASIGDHYPLSPVLSAVARGLSKPEECTESRRGHPAISPRGEFQNQKPLAASRLATAPLSPHCLILNGYQTSRGKVSILRESIQILAPRSFFSFSFLPFCLLPSFLCSHMKLSSRLPVNRVPLALAK